MMIHMKLDWFSCVVQKASIREIATVLGLDFNRCIIDTENEIANERRNDYFIENMRGCLSFRCFDYHGIYFRVSNLEWQILKRQGLMSRKIDIFNEICDKIFLEISGTGLDYLRGIHDTIDDMLMTEDLFGYLNDPDDPDGEPILRSHSTRADFAYDFVNCHESDFKQMYRELSDLQLAGAVYIPCIGSTAASHFEVHFGGTQETIYLGTTRGSRLLRIYNKKLERLAKDKKADFDGLWFTEAEKKNDPNFELRSWYRVEYQTRNIVSQNCLYDSGRDLSRVMREICNRYCLAYPRLEGYSHMQPIECFGKVFNYEGLTQIGLNNHFCRTYTPTVTDSVVRFEEVNFVSLILLLVLRNGSLISDYNKKIIDLYHSDSPAFKKRYQRLKRKVNGLLLSEGWCTIEESGFLYLNADGILQMREDKILSDEESTKCLELWRIEAAELKAEEALKIAEWFKTLYHVYCQEVGGLSNDKLMQRCVDITTSYLGYDAREGGDL